MRLAYQVQWFRRNECISTRRYGRLNTSIPKSVERLILEGHPNDVIQIVYGDQQIHVADLVIKVGSKINIHFSKELMT